MGFDGDASAEDDMALEHVSKSYMNGWPLKQTFCKKHREARRSSVPANAERTRPFLRKPARWLMEMVSSTASSESV